MFVTDGDRSLVGFFGVVIFAAGEGGNLPRLLRKVAILVLLLKVPQNEAYFSLDKKNTERLPEVLQWFCCRELLTP